MNRRIFIGATALFLFSTFFCGAALSANSKLENRLDECAYVLDEIMMMPENSIPDDLLKKCEAIGVFPSTVSGGFMVGGRFGQGIIITRDPETRKWTAPAFFTIGGASFGFQIGGQATDLVFVVTTRRGINSLVNDKVTLGTDAAVAAGPLGRKAEVATDVLMKASILSYSRSKGLFAGVALQGAVVSANKDDNKSTYGPDVTVEDILNGKVKATAEAQKLINTINKYAP